jgi:hypothetical protein
MIHILNSWYNVIKDKIKIKKGEEEELLVFLLIINKNVVIISLLCCSVYATVVNGFILNIMIFLKIEFFFVVLL